MATSAEIRQQLVAALRSDLIGPGWDDLARSHERLSQPPSVWYTTGFLVPHVFQQEAERRRQQNKRVCSFGLLVAPFWGGGGGVWVCALWGEGRGGEAVEGRRGDRGVMGASEIGRAHV